jgi:hypothetical protein
MGWWKVDGQSELGDGALDLADNFLARITHEYVSDLGRKPTLAEVLRTLEATLERRADEFVEDGEQFVVTGLFAKTKRRPKKQQLRVGDIFAVPLPGGVLAFGHLTPQRSFVEFFYVKGKTAPRTESLRSIDRIRLPFLVDLEPLETWRWKLVGYMPYDRASFVPQHFLIGGQTTCGEEEKNGFLDVSSRLCPATAPDSKDLPRMSIANEAFLVGELAVRLAQAPDAGTTA